MAVEDKLLNGAGLSHLASTIKGYIDEQQDEVYIGSATPPTTGNNYQIWIDPNGEEAAYLKNASISSNSLVITKSDNTTITYQGGGAPSNYIKSAAVNNKTLTLTDQDNQTTTFTDTGSTVSGTDDGTNWSTITIDGTTKAIPSGGGSSYTFTNGLTESSGTVGWYLNNYIKGPSSGLGGIVINWDHDYQTDIPLGQNSVWLCALKSNSLSGTNGNRAVAIGSGAAYGDDTIAGSGAYAIGARSIAIGFNCRAQKQDSICLGYSLYDSGTNMNWAGGNYSRAIGRSVRAMSMGQVAEGEFNVEDSTGDEATRGTYAYIFGNGTGIGSDRSNAYTLDWQGNATFAGTVSSVGADYAEYFEWEDGNVLEEDRIGYIVTLNGEKLVFADEGDDVLGIVSGTATILGDQAEWFWHKRFLQDEFGRFIYEDYDVEHPEQIDPQTGEIIQPAWTEHIHTRKQNPDWDPDEPYIKRSERPEWAEIGMMGKLFVRDDGTAAVNDYVKPVEGIATKSTERTNMRVMARVNDHVIKVVLK